MMLPNMPLPMFETRASGKLLLTGEYFVLDGALALAVPVRFGQTLRVEAGKEPSRLSWTSKTEKGIAWFLAEYELPAFAPLTFTDQKTAHTLADILASCQRQNPSFLAGKEGFKVLTQNDFPREWGLGTSSTLIASLAQWAGVNPYHVLFDTLGGSGYDIACAYAKGAILYRLEEGQSPVVQPVVIEPPFSHSLYFVYLGKKQDSRLGIQNYRERAKGDTGQLADISRLTERFLAAKNLPELDAVVREHEMLISRALDLPRAHDLYFSDFWGATKSLGAWGGDFVLATSQRPDAETRAYFQQKGFDVVLNWAEMVGTLTSP